MIPMLVMSRRKLEMRSWKKPVCQTLSMRTNIEAKKTSVHQSIFLKI